MEIAALAAVVALSVITAFQAALAFGAPLGRAAWGGQHPGVLPVRFRVASGVAAAVIYPLIIAAVLAAAGLVESAWLPGGGEVLLWSLVGFFGLGTLANLASRSPLERIWSPVSLIVAICCAIVASGL